MRFDIITIGSATIDVFVKPAEREVAKHEGHLDVCYHIGEKVLIEEMAVETGGGGTNCAVAFARLGFKTGWLGALGDDMNADIVRKSLEKEDVAVLGKTIAGMTGYSVIMTGLHHDRSILAFKGVNDKLSTFPALNTSWLYCSSMLGRSYATLVRAVTHAKKKGVKCAFNPSMYLAKQGVAKLRPLLDCCDLLICNKEEAAALLGARIMTVRQMLRSLQSHAKLVIITDGPAGAYATNGYDYWFIKPRPIKVIETTGAGDAFASGVVAGLIMRNDMEFALRCGMAEAESKIQHVGAKAGLLSRQTLLREATQYKVKQEML